MTICAKCPTRGCTTKEENKMPKKLCPSRDLELQEEARELYVSEDLKIEREATLVEGEGNCNWTRVREIVVFAKKMGYKKVGVAFCMGLHDESKMFVKILEHHGLEVVSIGCKNGANLKGYIGIKQEEKETYVKNDIMCNPIAQALYLNKNGVDLNILLGLCVGHDTLFIKHAKAPITVFAVKDRVLCNNPLGAIYGAEGYYKKKLFDEEF
ncbi:MAG: DUF1847 domain-containing protein [Clostridium chrysemydis]|uniref:DUF1847 domain-containing protein n=1 Tax=Clostridium chrysemydis TaxID=2665504 RepID=UPI003F3AF853